MRSIRDCRVCVVGGAGFLGSHLVKHLIEERGCRVLVIDNLVAGRREFIHKGADFEYHDITGSEDMLRGILKSYGVNFLFNYAAWPYIPNSFTHPIHVCNVNFFGAMKCINAAQEVGCEAILQVSSAELYGEHEAGTSLIAQADRIDEDCPVLPHSSYGASKAAADYYCQSAWRERNTPVIALRQFNCIGERETHPYVVPEIIGQLAKQAPIEVCDKCGGTGEGWKGQGTGDGEGFRPGVCIFCDGLGERPYPVNGAVVKLGNNSFRDFLYAGDAVRIAVELLERGQFGEVYNLGSESGIKIYDLAKLIGNLMGFEDVQIEQDQARVRPWEIWHLQSDNSKIKSLWGKGEDMPLAVGGWCADMYSLEHALKKTITYYEQNGRKWCWE